MSVRSRSRRLLRGAGRMRPGRVLACVAACFAGASAVDCSGSNVPCHNNATQCCSPVWCGDNITDLDTQACGDQAAVAGERALPQGDQNTCTCYTSAVQGKSYKCAGRCLREELQCDGVLEFPYQTCGSGSWPSGDGYCVCQTGYRCSVSATDATVRECTRTSCDLSIFACEEYADNTGGTTGGCVCTRCSSTHSLSGDGSECLERRKCGEVAASQVQCPGDARLQDSTCRCDAFFYCAGSGPLEGKCIQKDIRQCGQTVDPATQRCPLEAPADPSTSMCACTSQNTCLPNMTCGKELRVCDETAQFAYQECSAPTSVHNGMCRCPSWGACKEGQCVQTRCEGEVIEGCDVYRHSTPGESGCLCRRCKGTGAGIMLTDGGKVCRPQIGCLHEPIPGSKEVCAVNSHLADKTCECDADFVCHNSVCILTSSTVYRTFSPTLQQRVLVGCDRSMPSAGSDGKMYVCTEHASPNENNICKCMEETQCSRSGYCSREAVVCGGVISFPYAYCRDIEAFRDPITGVCTCSDDHVCHVGECVANSRGNRETTEHDRRAVQISLAFVGANLSDLVDAANRPVETATRLKDALISDIASVDPAFVSQEKCRVLNPPGISGQMTRNDADEFRHDLRPCAQVLRICKTTFHDGPHGAYRDAEFSPDRESCVSCNCWYPTIEFYGWPYGVKGSSAIQGQWRRATGEQATGAPIQQGERVVSDAAEVTSKDLAASGTIVSSLGTDAAVALGSFRIDLMLRGRYAQKDNPGSTADSSLLSSHHRQGVEADVFTNKLLQYFCGARTRGRGVCEGYMVNVTGLGTLRLVSATPLALPGEWSDPESLPQAPYMVGEGYSGVEGAGGGTWKVLVAVLASVLFIG
eukprot:Hpha_TRINITY_DN11103_c0_g1::TRINITY_DN11103_c0_g1_i1::g.28247::m.28247